MSIAGGPDIVENGLVLHLDAADRNSYPGSGTVWINLNNPGITGTLTNGPTYSLLNKGYFSFDGSDDFYVISTGIPQISNTITCDIWVYPNSLTGGAQGYSTLLKTAQITGIQEFYFHLINSTANFGTEVRNDADNSWLYYRSDNNILSINNWYNIVQVLDVPGGYIRFYLNGQSVGNRVIGFTHNLSCTDLMTVAQQGTDPAYTYARKLNGRIASVKLYSRALSASEVLQNYNATKGRYGL